MKHYALCWLLLALSLSASGQVITQWNFNSSLTAPSVGTGTFINIGGTSAASNNGGPSDPASPNMAFEVSAFPAATANNKTAGVEIAVSTVGKTDIFLTFDQRPSNTSPKRTTVFYSTNGGGNWTEFGYYDAPTGDSYFSRSYDFSTITALNNNANARFRLVAAFSNAANTSYQAATSSSTYSSTNGKWRFDVVTVRSGSGVTVPPGTPNRATEQNPAVIGNVNGTNVSNGGYGSDLKAVPGQPGFYYGLTDRGPNVGGSGGGKAFPVPGYTPMIGKFEVVGSSLVLRQQILFKDGNGVNLNGLPNAEQSTANGYQAGQDAESAQDGNGNALSPNADNRGIDSEGLAAMTDGTFWVSDEYGPYLCHFSASGVLLEKVSPIAANGAGHKLPAVLLRRKLNNGMEGLCTTQDGTQLVGLMQNKLFNPSQSAVSSSRVVRLITYNPATGSSGQFVYLLESTSTDVCAIFPVTATDYLVLERDGNTSFSAFKRVFRVSLAGATDISDPADGASGKLYGGQTVDQLNDATGLSAQGIVPVSKVLLVDLQTAIGGGYPHEKAEGLIITSDTELAVINDDDFGINGSVGSVVPKTDASGVVEQTRLYFVALSTSLPVTYLNFAGRMTTTGAAVLTWSTASERSNAYFEVERSPDAVTYSTLGRVAGTGNSTVRQNYALTDEAPVAGWNYYRLRQVDHDGTASVSRVIGLRREGGPEVTLYPNPTHERLWVRWSAGAASGQPTISLYDTAGRLRRQAVATSPLTELRVTDLPSGLYLVRCQQEGQPTQTRQVLID